MEEQKETQNSNNPSAEQVQGKAKTLTGEDLLKHIDACRAETRAILKKVPYKIAQKEQFLNILSQIKNDQEICLKYINILEENVKSLKEEDIGSLPEALLATKNRISSEMKMVDLIATKNPFEKELTDTQIKTQKMETLYALNAYSSMSRTQEEIEWSKYKTFSEERQLSLSKPQQVEKSNGFNPFGLIVVGFILFVVFKRSQWVRNAVGQVLKTEPKVEKTPEKDKKEDGEQV